MKSLRAILGVVLVVLAFYCAWKLIPPYFANYQLEDAIAEEARINTYTPKSEQDMRHTIFKKAQDLEIPIQEEEVKVQRSGNSVAIWIDYSVHVDLPGYPMDLQFHPSSKNKGL